MGESGRVLVTGACGVNGVWVLRELLERGAVVLATDLAPELRLAPDLAGEVELRAVDVSRPEGIGDAVAEFRPEVIVHMAALMPQQIEKDPQRGYRVNVMGTANVMEAAAEAGVRRVLFTSSKAAYGEVIGPHAHPTYEPLPETAPLRPVALYDFAKIASEGIGASYARAGRVEFAALRFATIYGPGKLERHGPMSLVSRLVEDPFAGRSVEVAAGGDQRDDLIYVKDVGRAIADAALHPDPWRHRVYNVGTGVGVTLREVAAAVRSQLPDAEIEIGPGLDPMRFGVSYYAVMDCSRTAEELGFRADFEIEDGIRDYLQLLESLQRLEAAN